MKARTTTYAIILLILVSTAKSFGQVDSLRAKAITYLSQHLQTDTVTAGKVFFIQENYKKAMTTIIVNGSLTGQQKRIAMDSLIDQKNRQLAQLLTSYQMIMIVPTTERRRTWTPDSTSQKTH